MKRRVAIALAAVCALVAVPAWAQSKTGKPAMAVIEFNNTTSAGWWTGGLGSELADMLTNELAATEKFKMIERKQLAAVLTEQDLGASGRVTPQTAAKVGKMTGAKFLVSGTVSAYEESVKGTGGGLKVKGIGLGGSKGEAYMAIDLRVIDSTTGEIEQTRTVEARSSSKSIGVAASHGSVGGNFAKMEKTPAGQAIRACVIEASEYLACVMVDKDGCESEYAAKDASRREKAKKGVKIQ
jgi:curli biogenesis system outer membrane secretion channel CsgG